MTDIGYGPGITREDALDQHLAETLIRVAELTEMLTAATDTAVQRGKRIDELDRYVVTLDSVVEFWRGRFYELDGADGGCPGPHYGEELNTRYPYVSNTCMLCGNGVPFELGLCHEDDVEEFQRRHMQQFHPTQDDM